MHSRKLEKDYKNIEDQIRCLKLRMLQQNQADAQMRNQNAGAEDDAFAQTEQLSLEASDIDRRAKDLDQKYQRQKQEYIRLNNLEGELHAQMSTFRNSTSDQMMQNK